MERDAIIAHGAARFLKERLFDKSDPYTMIVCDKCGNIAASQTDCHVCDSDNLSTVNIPYAAKLLFQELMAMGVKISVMPEKQE